MEVHHHAHPEGSGHRKKWTHYFWEFLMLFLAVFCGFIAENIREHQVENHRAKTLAKNLYKEIYADSIKIGNNIAIRKIKEKECEYFINYVRDSSLTNPPAHFYRAFTWAFVQSAQLLFEPNDGILNQLRNSGELRYFRNSRLQTRIGELNVAIANLRSRNEKEYSYIEFYLRPFTIKHFDFAWYEQLTEHGKTTLLDALLDSTRTVIPGKLIHTDKFDRKEAENIASYYLLMLRGTRQIQYIPYSSSNHRLLEILREEYHLE